MARDRSKTPEGATVLKRIADDKSRLRSLTNRDHGQGVKKTSDVRVDFCADWTMVEIEDLYLPTAGKPSTSSRWSLIMTTAFPLCLNRRKTLYRAAILVTNQRLLPQRVSEAEAALIARRREIFYADGTPEETEALEDALYALHAFTTAWQHSEPA